METRSRNRWIVPLGVLTAVAMLAGWFPATSLFHQQTQLNDLKSQINAVQRQDSALRAQSKSDDTKNAATQLARAQYQLVAPGQSLIQVLPGDSAGQVSASSADPGLQPLVSPSATTPLGASSSTHHRSNAYLERLARTLEFWR